MAKATTNTKEVLPAVMAALRKVREMREAQKTYVQYRYKENLQNSQRLEDEVDQLLEQVVPKGQRKLF